MKLVKICGIKRFEAAEQALEYGADLIGMIMVPGRARTIEIEEAKKIAELVRAKRSEKNVQFNSIQEIIEHLNSQEFESVDDYCCTIACLLEENGPFCVGVFRNQPIAEVFRISEEVGIDVIQLHGKENKLEYCNYNKQNFDGKYGIIPRYVIPTEIPAIYTALEEIFIGGKYFGNGFLLPLLDSEMGGEGIVLDWSILDELTQGKYILAGGLTEYNILELTGKPNLVGIDVSGGVEVNGEKDAEKMKSFIENGKTI